MLKLYKYALLVAVSILLVRSIASADQTIRYLCLPHIEPPAKERPTPDEIHAFWEKHRDHLGTTESELLRDPDFARCVLGNTRVYTQIADFEAHSNYRVKVVFINPAEWFRRVKAESERSEPIVCQVGDTWLRYFEDEGVVRHSARFFYDIRLLWYRKDLIKASDLKNQESFLKTAKRLRDKGVVPLAIPIARDPNAIWNLSVFIKSAGGRMVDSKPLAGLIPWNRSAVDDSPARTAANFLKMLSEENLLDLPQSSNMEYVDAFLDGKCAMVIMEPFVAGIAAQKFKQGWENKIGAVMPPAFPGHKQSTFIGGSMLVVMARHGVPERDLAGAKAWQEYLCKAGTQLYLPANAEAWRRSPYKGTILEDFKNQLSDQAANYFPGYPGAVESPTVADDAFWFWQHIAALRRAGADEHGESSVDSELLAQRRAVDDALRSMASDMNANLSPGSWVVAVLKPMVVLLVVATLGIWCRHRWMQGRWLEKLEQDRQEIASLKREVNLATELRKRLEGLKEEVSLLAAESGAKQEHKETGNTQGQSSN